MKNLFGIIGLLLIVGTLYGGNWKTLSDWSSAELVGYNIWTIVAILGGIILAFYGLKKKKKPEMIQ